MRFSTSPDLRRRRISWRELAADYAEEKAEAELPTLRAWQDDAGWCLEIDGVPLRRRDAYRDDRPAAAWSVHQAEYEGLD